MKDGWYTLNFKGGSHSNGYPKYEHITARLESGIVTDLELESFEFEGVIGIPFNKLALISPGLLGMEFTGGMPNNVRCTTPDDMTYVEFLKRHKKKPDYAAVIKAMPF